MTSINPINVNTQGVGSSYGYGAKPQTEKEEVEEVKPGSGQQKTQLSADEVFSFLAQTGVVIAPKTVDPAKYVDKTSEERIAGFMAGFEEIVATNLAVISKEFPDMSDGAKQSLALAQFDCEQLC